MTCVKCGAVSKKPTSKENDSCKNCAAAKTGVGTCEQEPLTAIGQQTDFLCPTCPDHNLQVGDLFGTQVCFCDQCSGFVIDRVSLGDLVEKLRAAYNGPDDKPQTINPAELHESCTCPACFDTMETFNYYGPGNVVLDTCDPCKLTWFNQGELGKIIRAPGKRSPPPSYNQESNVLRHMLHSQAAADGIAGLLL